GYIPLGGGANAVVVARLSQAALRDRENPGNAIRLLQPWPRSYMFAIPGGKLILLVALTLHDSIVTHTLLGATAAALLYPFAKGAGRFALWLVGRTGAGKSFVAKLFSNFFGNFPVSSAPFTTWSATPNYVQRQGYFFKDALYLVDDYKPEVVQPYQVVRVLQTYADNTARGRLKADATANGLRPIRGLLVCTGEDVPEHNASAVARSVIVRVPQQAKNVRAGTRCLAECQNYSGVMADFIRWLLAEGRTKLFLVRFAE